MRYRLLETVRQYAADRLAETGERDWVRDRHGDHFLALAEEAVPYLESEGHDEWLERLDPESANFLAAIEHAAATWPGIALRFCTALFLWWRARRLWAEAEAANARSLAAADGEPPGPRAGDLWVRGVLCPRHRTAGGRADLRHRRPCPGAGSRGRRDRRTCAARPWDRRVLGQAGGGPGEPQPGGGPRTGGRRRLRPNRGLRLQLPEHLILRARGSSRARRAAAAPSRVLHRGKLPPRYAPASPCSTAACLRRARRSMLPWRRTMPGTSP